MEDSKRKLRVGYLYSDFYRHLLLVYLSLGKTVCGVQGAGMRGERFRNMGLARADHDESLNFFCTLFVCI